MTELAHLTNLEELDLSSNQFVETLSIQGKGDLVMVICTYFKYMALK